MTDKELIKAFRRCNSYEVCPECPFDGKTECPIAEFTAEKLVNRLEALLAENERLKTQVPQWKPGSEPPPKNGVYIVRIKGATKVTTLNCNVNSENGKYSWFTKNDFYLYDVTHWMPLPELPKMEDTP